MSAEENKAVVRRLVETLNRANWAESIGEFMPLFVEQFVEVHSQFRAAFPDYQMTIDDMVGEEDRVVFRGTVRATHRGEYPAGELKGVAPTGKRLEWTEIHMLRLADGKIVDGWLLVDGVSRLQQLGVLPAPA